MSYQLYWISGSPNAWRVALTMEIKGLSYVSHRLDPGKGEHKAAEFLALNPRGKVPVLKDGDFVLYESLAIMTYLERKHPAPPLFGRTDEEHGRIWQRVCETMNYARDDIEKGVVSPLFRGQAGERGTEIRISASDVHRSLEWLEEVLGKTDYLAGDGLSAADVAYVPIVQGLARAGQREDARKLELGFDTLRETYPAIGRWLAAIEALPAYDRAYPPHWRGL